MIKSHCRLANFTSEWTCNKNLAHLFWQVTLLIKGTLHGLKSAGITIFPTWHLISSSPRLGKTSSHVQNLNHTCLETAAEMHWEGGLVCWRLPASYRTQKWCVVFFAFFPSVYPEEVTMLIEVAMQHTWAWRTHLGAAPRAVPAQPLPGWRGAAGSSAAPMPQSAAGAGTRPGATQRFILTPPGKHILHSRCSLIAMAAAKKGVIDPICFVYRFLLERRPRFCSV